MTSGRLLARNTVLNVVAQVGPLAVAVVAVPILINGLGDGRFGVLGLAWALIGYFSLFDLGIGRALTQSASEALGRQDHDHLIETSSAAITAMFVLGLVGALIIVAMTPWLAYRFLKMDDVLRPEAARSFLLLALSLPFVLTTLGLRGLFEAHQHFGLATMLRLPYALFNFIGPLLVLPLTKDLTAIVGVLVFGRLVTWGAHTYFAKRRYPWLRYRGTMSPGALGPLLRFGGWITVSNVISPLMVNLDRFLIGALISMSAVAFYVTPYEVVSKMLFVPAAVLGVFFPALAATFVRDRAHTALIMDRAMRLMITAMFPVLLIVVAFAHEGLQFWVGKPEFAREGAVVLQILAIGVLVNALGQAPFSLLQAVGRADVTAKLHLIELPMYGAMILYCARTFGLAGVALAWTLRIVIDTTALWWIARRLLPEASSALTRALSWTVALTGILVVFSGGGALRSRLIAVAVVLLAFGVASWWILLKIEERRAITDMLRPSRGRPVDAI